GACGLIGIRIAEAFDGAGLAAENAVEERADLVLGVGPHIVAGAALLVDRGALLGIALLCRGRAQRPDHHRGSEHRLQTSMHEAARHLPPALRILSRQSYQAGVVFPRDPSQQHAGPMAVPTDPIYTMAARARGK